MKRIKVIFSLAFLLTMLLPLTHLEICSLKNVSLFAQTNDQCSQQLNAAEEEYNLGNWTESITIVQKCLMKSNLSEIEKGKAYRILSLVHIAMQSEKEANNSVKNLLTMSPNYKIVPEKDPPSLQKIIDDITYTLTPEINNIIPRSREQNKEGFIMTVQGSNFVYGSEVRINGTGRATTFISDTLLKAKISASDMLIDDEYDITVHSPISNGRISNPKKFVVESSSMSLWKWIATGGAAIALVVSTVLLLEPDPDVKPIAEPPGRP